MWLQKFCHDFNPVICEFCFSVDYLLQCTNDNWHGINIVARDVEEDIDSNVCCLASK